MTACSDLEPVSIPPVSKVSPTILHSGARTSQVYDFGLGGYITTYDVDPAILGYFQHYWQNTTTNLLTDPQKNNSCGATSYMMVANCLALSKGLTYGVTKEKQAQIVNQVGAPTKLDNLRDYVTLFDSGFLTKTLTNNLPATVTGRASFKTVLESTLANNGFIIASVNAYVISASTLVHTDPYYSTDVTFNPDLDLPSNSGQKYITANALGSTSGGYGVGGHIIIIIAIKKNPDGSGVVTYIDPISKSHSPSNRKYVNYARFLDAVNSSTTNNNYYQCLSIYKK